MMVFLLSLLLLASGYNSNVAFSPPILAFKGMHARTTTIRWSAPSSSTTRSQHLDERGGVVDIIPTSNNDDLSMTLAGLKKDIDAAPATSENSSLRYSMRQFVIGKARFSRDSLGKLGMSALLAYGFVSNISGVIAVSSAWFVFCKKTGVSPLAPGQKPAFLVTYAAFSVILNVVRPARFALSMAISPYFERVRKAISTYLSVSTRRAAVIMIVMINMVGGSSLMIAGVGLASWLSGVPVWAPVTYLPS